MVSLARRLGAALLVGALGCGAPDAAREGAHAAAAGRHDAGGDGSDHAAHAAPAGAGEALRPIMQRLGAEMNALTYALMTDDTAAVARSAAAIAEHAPISAGELARIQAALGPEMERFEALDVAVHEASLRLRDAARAGNPDTVVARLSDVQRGCIACHAEFRERLRAAPAPD